VFYLFTDAAGMAGRYKILDQLGVGGLGAVFKAYDTQLNRYVAIKRLLSKEEVEKEDAQSGGLRQEAASLAALQHPNIVSVFDLANDEEGFFIVMELLEGETLGDWIRNGVLGLTEFYDMATQTLEAILTAHHQSILHRDLKPENIKMVRLPGGRLQVKVLDFGLARQSYGARKMTEDQSGNIMGSIYYMAPEQLMRKPVDGRTDLYALGCLFYQLISGHRPFDGATVQEIMNRHLQHQVYPLHEIAPHLPGPICDWVMWLLNLDPGHRPANAQQALNSLREIHEAGWFKSAADAPMAVVMEEAPAPAQVRRTTGQQPPRPITGNVARRTSANIPTAAAPAGFVRTATGALRPASGTPAAARSTASKSPVNRKVAGAGVPAKRLPVEEPPKKGIPVWVWPLAGLLLILAAWTFWPRGGKTPVPVATTPAAESAAIGDPAALASFNGRPADLILPNASMHYVVGQKMNTFSGAVAKPGELIEKWHDLQSQGGDAVLSNYDGKRETCPTYHQEKFAGFKSDVHFLRFDRGEGMVHRMSPGSSGTYAPLGDPSKKGVTFFMLIHPVISGTERTYLEMADDSGKTTLAVRATAANEFKLIITVDGNRREAKIIERNTKLFNLVSVIWDAMTNRALLTVRSADGTKSRAEVETPKLTREASLTQLKISRGPAEQAVLEDYFVGDMAELAVWPFPMTWEDRNLQDWKLSQHYLITPGSRY